MKFVLEEPLSEANTRIFAETSHFDDIYIRDKSLVTVDVAKKYLRINSVTKLSLWCDVTRAAMGHITSLPNLTELIVFELVKSGRLSGFEGARHLTYFSCVFGLTEIDLLEVAKCQTLERLGAQQSKVTSRALDAILALPLLREVDFEDSNFNDHHAKIMAQSTRVKKLDLGATRITRDGLKHICKMKQLRELDVWSNNIDVDDLELLSELPNLEYLSVGGHDEQTKFTAENTIPKLEKIPSLKRIWLDGVTLTPEERGYLNNRYETVKPN